MTRSRYVGVQVDEVLHKTAAAYLCMIDDEKVWIPFSHMENPEAVAVGDTDVEVMVTTWLAETKNLHYEV